jgi:hypothetical protein
VIGRGCLLLGALAATTGAGCLLYTGRINHPPTVTVSGPDRADRGAAPVFAADAGDEDQGTDSLSVEWRWRTQDPAEACPPADGGLAVPAAQAGPGAGGRSFTLHDTAQPGSTCVWAVVRDEDGATAWAGRTVQIEDLPPRAAIDVVSARMAPDGNFELYAPVHLSAARSVDPENDALSVEWALTANGQTGKPDPCPMVPDDVCVTLDRPGTYLFSVTVSDRFGRNARDERTLMVGQDRPPCIQTTMPDFRVSTFPQKVSDSLHFELDVVDDDGEPYPAAADRAAMVWEWRFDDSADPGWTRRVHYLLPTLDFKPGDFIGHVGHQLLVRLTYQDRVVRDLSGCVMKGSGCTVVEPSRACYQQVSWAAQIF